jgi:regulator of cell morphogenesis and NO signaling
LDRLRNLITHILDKHHVFTKDELDRLDSFMTNVATVYAERRPEIERVKSLFFELKRELTTHMLKEEQVLFPYVEQMEDAAINKTAPPRPFFGTVRNPVRMMMMEHDAAGEMLRELRSLTNNYTAPEDACISYKTLYRALEELELDLHQHIHLENNILFPRVAEMESAL